MKHRSAVVAGTLFLAAVALYLSLGPPRVLWLNAGLTLAYDWTKGLSALVAAALVGAAAFLAPLRAARVAALVAAGGLAVFGVARLVYRVDVVADAIAVRNVLGTTRIPWKAVTRIDATPGHLTAVADGAAIRIGTASLSADERAALERTVSRRLREGEGPTGAGPAAAR